MALSSRTPDRVAYAFYTAAAAAALVGQVWAAVDHIPWPDTLPTSARIALVTPAVGVLELGGVATSALADSRRRLGESATAYRVMSAAAAVVAIVFNLIGHADQPYLAFGFAGLSGFAYALWLAHSGARRRDALRESGHMARTTPVYGLMQWLREPALTRRARALAMERDLGLHDSLAAAREDARTATRRKAIAAVVEQIIRADHTNPLHAQIAASTYDMDRLATEIEARADYAGWADRISQSLSPGVSHPSEPAPVAPTPPLEARPFVPAQRGPQEQAIDPGGPEGLRAMPGAPGPELPEARRPGQVLAEHLRSELARSTPQPHPVHDAHEGAPASPEPSFSGPTAEHQRAALARAVLTRTAFGRGHLAPDGAPLNGHTPDGYAPDGYAPNGHAPDGGVQLREDGHPTATIPMHPSDAEFAEDLDTLHGLSNKRDAIRYAFSRVGSDNVPSAVAWLAERGVTVSRSEAYTLRIEEQKDAQRRITLVANGPGAHAT
ncbi:hypothetical protein [Cryptosporangium phraense]|uniref:DUF2637 domain-containing protein n=1 Tax=Cryptosporangium phraense TaxID=2593070 RepID=A0A545AUS5_9ACTN|nr:hypothetical protein [Cryptosporangium phraense]TQS45089.1 hypothetical protein FL583_11360 [Cryptosporangium phraense]